jgi:hypothetical protein
MEHNPYSPPAAAVADVMRAGTLYSPRQIFFASFMGSPVAAAWFMHRNFMTLGHESHSLRALWLGLAATVAALVAAFYLPNHFPNVVLPIAYSYAIYQYSRFLFNTSYNEHVSRGGRKGPWWLVIVVSTLTGLALLGVVFAIAFAAPSLFENR